MKKFLSIVLILIVFAMAVIIGGSMGGGWGEVSASQADMDISTSDANTGVTYRAAVNEALQALASGNSGPGDPSVMYPYQIKFDTSLSPVVAYLRKADNSGWVRFGYVDATTKQLIVDAATIANAVDPDAIDGSMIADDAVGAEHIEELDDNLFFANNRGIWADDTEGTPFRIGVFTLNNRAVWGSIYNGTTLNSNNDLQTYDGANTWDMHHEGRYSFSSHVPYDGISVPSGASYVIGTHYVTIPAYKKFKLKRARYHFGTTLILKITPYEGATPTEDDNLDTTLYDNSGSGSSYNYTFNIYSKNPSGSSSNMSVTQVYYIEFGFED